MRARPFAIAALVYSALAIAVTFPLILHLASVVPSDLGDPLLSTAILWWNAHVMPLTDRWWNGFAFSPATGMLAFSDHRLGLSLIASPLQWLGANPITAYNIVFLATFPLCALSGHALGWVLTKRHDAAAICGLAFGFNPFRVAHRSHLELLAAFGMPLALAGLHLYVREHRTRWIVAFALSLIVLGLSSTYYLLFFSVLLGLWILWFVRDWRTLRVIAVASLAAAAALLPLALGYQRIHAFYGFARSLDDITPLSADLTSFLASSPSVALWGFTASLARGPFPGERQLFPGLTISVLAAVGCVMLLRRGSSGIRTVWSHRPPLPFYLLAAGVLFLCSMGPVPTFFGKPVLRHGPYALLMMLPGFAHSVRAPARFALPALLALAAAAALAFNRLTLSPSTRRTLALVVLAGIVADSWTRRLETPRVPLAWRPPAGYDFGAAIELPLSDFGDFAAMYRATRHGHPIANGHSGFTPPHYLALQTSLAEGDVRGLDALAGAQPLLIALDVVADTDGRWTLMLSREARITRLGDDGRWTFYGMSGEPRRSCQAPDLPIASVHDANGGVDLHALTDRDSATMWTTGRPQRRDDTITIELAKPARLCDLRFSIGTSWNAFPRDLEVATSGDGSSWTRRFDGSPAGLLVRGALANPTEIWIALPLDGAYARFVRLRLNASHPTAPWLMTELRASGS